MVILLGDDTFPDLRLLDILLLFFCLLEVCVSIFPEILLTTCNLDQ